MSEITPFIRYFIEENHKKRSLHELYDANFNQLCNEIHNHPVDISPKMFSGHEQPDTNSLSTLNIYPSKKDKENYLLKAEQLIGAIHNIKKRAVFEIRGNKQRICTQFYGDSFDLGVIESAINNFHPESLTEIGKIKYYSGTFYVYDFIPQSTFFKSLTTFQDFEISPINIIPQILNEIDDGEGVYQVLVTPLPGNVHDLVAQAIDTEWQALRTAENITLPSQQPSIATQRLEYKSPDFKNYFSVCTRLILPTDKLLHKVKAFISNYVYGSRAFTILDNDHYSQEQISQMLNMRVAFHSGYLVNSHELTSLLHVPYEVLDKKEYVEIFQSAPVGDKPLKATEYEDVVIGKWACGNNSLDIHLPIQKEIPHVHICGVSRSGKSILLSHIAIEKLKRGEAVFVLDPHGDLIDVILKMVPKQLLDKAIVIDFGLKGFTPQITIKGNVDINNPSKVSDDLTMSMKDVAGEKDSRFFGPKMMYAFQCLYFIYCVIPELDLTHIRLLISRSKRAKVLRAKVKARIEHPIVRDFLDELECTSYEPWMPTALRLAHLLLDENSLRLFTLTENKISIKDIMENGQLCLVNVSTGIIGRQRSSILSGTIDSLISNNALARASIPYDQRKPCTIIKDEFYLGPGDLDSQLTGLAKYGLSVIFAHQYLDQVEGNTREVMATAGSRIFFKLRRKDAEKIGKDFDIDPEELTSLRKFQAIIKVEDEVIKINAPMPLFNEQDFSKEIIQNSIDKYYLKNSSTSPFAEKKQLTFDTL